MELENEFEEFDRKFRKDQKRKRKPPPPPMPVKISFYEYLANRVPSDAHFLINKYGKYRMARNERELEYQLKDFVKTFGEKGLKALGGIHPDKELLITECKPCKEKEKQYLELLGQYNNKETQPTQQYYNASGKISEETILRKMNYNLLVLGGFVLMGVALMIKTK